MNNDNCLFAVINKTAVTRAGNSVCVVCILLLTGVVHSAIGAIGEVETMNRIGKGTEPRGTPQVQGILRINV